METLLKTIAEREDEDFEILESQEFDAGLWAKWLTFYSESDNRKAQRAMRRLIQSGTLKAIRSGLYAVKNRYGRVETVTFDARSLRECCLGVKYYTSKMGQTLVRTILTDQRRNGKDGSGAIQDTKVSVLSGDCLVAAKLLKTKYNRVAVLNMASDKRPGGGYKDGSAAQEENLFRRTNLAFSLEDIDGYDLARNWTYPIPEFGGIHVPNVQVFRGSEQAGYPFLRDLYTVDVICVAAYSKPPLVASGTLLEASIADRLKQKMRTILAIAYEHHIEAVVLSAFGCGAYRCPPGHVASLFHEVVKEFDGLFKCVHFAIYDDQNAKRHSHGNVQPFAREFNQTPLLLPL